MGDKVIMKLRKVSSIFVLTIIIAIIASIFNASYADNNGDAVMWLNINMFRKSGYAYKALGTNRKSDMENWKNG